MSNRYLHVPGAQVTKNERRIIKRYSELISNKYKEPVMVNIGIMWGCTLWCLRDGAPNAIIAGVDITPEKWKITDEDELDVAVLEGDSRTMPFGWPIHLLLIDGDHHYDVVHADIENWVPRVTVGGIVIFHDYAPSELNMRQFPELEGVKRAADEYFATSEHWRQVDNTDSIQIYERLS